MSSRASTALACAVLILAALGPVPAAAASPPKPPTRSQTSAAGASNTAAGASSSAAATVAPGAWAWQNPQPDGVPIFGISCPSATACFAATGAGQVRITTDGGATWSSHDIASGNVLTSISCPTTTACVTVGFGPSLLRTADGGTTWTGASLPAPNRLGSGFLDGVSCFSASGCFAISTNAAVFDTADGGATWAELAQDPVGNGMSGISCVSFGSCYAVGGNGTSGALYQVTNAGVTPIGLAPSTPPLDGISCLTGLFGQSFAGVVPRTRCAAVGRQGYWAILEAVNAALPTASVAGNTTTKTELTAVSCWSLEECVAASVDGSTYIEAPSKTWGQESTSEEGSLFAVSCPGGARCYVGGDFSATFTTLDGGMGWSSQTPRGQAFYHDVACATASLCFVANNDDLLRTTDGGASWQDQPITTDLVDKPGYKAVACPSSTTCFAAGLMGIIVTTDGGDHWTPQADANPGPADINAMSCPTTTVCFALGVNSISTPPSQADLIGTSDGGATWKLVKTFNLSYPSIPSANALSCPSPSVCFVATYPNAVTATTDGGATWQTQSATNMLGISCPSTSTCFAVGLRTIEATVNGGATWTDETPATGLTNWFSISCPSTTQCMAGGVGGSLEATTDGTHWVTDTSGISGQPTGVACTSVTTCLVVTHLGEIVGTTDFGATPWHFLVEPQGPFIPSLQAVSCASATLCFGIYPSSSGGSIWRSGNGRSWLPVTATSLPAGPAGIACPGPTTCFIASSNSVVVTTDGVTWNPETSQLTASGIACASTTSCVEVDATGFFSKTTDGGATWSPPARFTTMTGSGPISCVTATTICYAIAGHDVFVTKDGASTWQLSFDVSTDPNGGTVQAFTGIACPDAMDCYASNAGGVIGMTVNGGRTWVTDFTNVNTNLSGVSCPSPSTCFFTSTSAQVVKTADYGLTWESQSTGRTGDLNGIACVSTTTCVAVGQGIAATSTGGGGWSRQQPAGGNFLLRRIACPDSLDCYSVGFDALNTSGIEVTHNGGASWTLHTLSKFDNAEGVACTGPSTCYTVGWPGAIYFTNDGGTTWTYQASPVAGTDQTLQGIACPAAGTCYVVGTSGTILATTDGGATWQLQTPAITTQMVAIHCTTATTCVAVGPAGAVETLSAGTWTSRTSGTTHNLHAVTCQGGTCYAAGNFGVMLVSQDGGVTWTASTTGVTTGLYGVACASSTRCAAVGLSGTMIVTADGTNWASIPLPTADDLFGVTLAGPSAAWITGAGGSILANPNAINVCLSPSVSSDLTSPQDSGAPITLTASSLGCVNATYRFEMLAPGSQTWQVVQPYSLGATFAWNTVGAPQGTYGFIVKAMGTNSPGLAGNASGRWDSYATFSFTLTTHPCANVSAISSPSGTAAGGTPVTITGIATGCPNARYQFEMLAPGSQTWQVVQPYSSGRVFNWVTAGAPSGTYSFIVKARDLSSPGLAGASTGSWDAYTLLTYTLTAVACSSVTASSSPVGTALSSSTVTLTAKALGCPNALYQFEEFFPGPQVWKPVQPYSTAGIFTWNTLGAAAGGYRFIVKVRDASSVGLFGSDGGAWDAYTTLDYTLTSMPCASVALQSAPMGTALSGTPVTFTAAATGCPHSQYQFEMLAPGSQTWQVVQPYLSGVTIFNWVTAGAPPGTYGIIVKARDVSSAGVAGTGSGSWDAYQLLWFSLTSTPCASVSATASPPGSSLAGMTATFTATPSGCQHPQYQFEVLAPGSSGWQVAQTYSPNNQFVWLTPIVKGTYYVIVKIRDASSLGTAGVGNPNGAWDAYTTVIYTLY